MKVFAKYSFQDMVETLDDFYLIFLNKYEDVVLLIIKLLVLGLGCSFEIERKVSQKAINFDYGSRMFRNFLNIFCKLFGCTFNLKQANGSSEIYSYDSSQAKIQIGTDRPIDIEISDNDTLTLIYDPKFFYSKDLDIDYITFSPVQELETKVHKSFTMLKKEFGIQDEPQSKEKEKSTKSKQDEDHFMEEEYYSNHNIINPFSLYSSEIDFRKTIHEDTGAKASQIQKESLQVKIEDENDKMIDLSQYYSGDQGNLKTINDSLRQDDSPGIKPFLVPAKKLNVLEPPQNFKKEVRDDPSGQTAAELQPIEEGLKGVVDCQKDDHIVPHRMVEDSFDYDDNDERRFESQDASIFYHYDLQKTINLNDGTDYFESLIKDSQVKTTAIGDFVPGIPKRPDLSLANQSPENSSIRQEKVSEPVPIRTNLGDHIKVLMTNELENSGVGTISEKSKEDSPSAYAGTFANDIKKLITMIKINNAEEAETEKDPEIAKSEPAKGREQANTVTGLNTDPGKSQVSNPLMTKLNFSPQAANSQNKLTQSSSSKSLLEVAKEDHSKKRPTASVDLIQQISEALRNKVISDANSSIKSDHRPIAVESLDFGRLEDHDAEHSGCENIERRAQERVESEIVTRKSKLLKNSETDKPCRICGRIYKMTKMFFYDHSFFCDTCYYTACMKLKRKGIQNCSGCSQHSAKVLIVKFLISNKFTKHEGTLLFTRDLKVQSFYEFLHKYPAMISRSPALDRALKLISENVITPIVTMAEIKVCKSCEAQFVKCSVCKDLLHKDEMFAGEECSHMYCLYCLSLIFMKKYASKTVFTCKGTLCWKKTSLEKVLQFITAALEKVQEDFGANRLTTT